MPGSVLRMGGIDWTQCSSSKSLQSGHGAKMGTQSGKGQVKDRTE